ncbi:helix-turn-helix transcriptional regulator, partial [Streptomyces flaveolus]|uniref:helix-turn-helix transcriptional regulator n=1 Tax=Streptomyces flaveolus TaxID=67297 RepID=UPI00340E8DCA
MELAQQVGSRLRELRVERNLSLSALARRSGVGKGTLSELEAGRRNATLETLYALTTALGTPLTAVLGPDPARAPLSGRAVDAVLVERYEDPAAITEIYRIRIRTGAVQESDAHPSGTEEHLIVLSGTARVGAASAPVEAGPGEHAHW